MEIWYYRIAGVKAKTLETVVVSSEIVPEVRRKIDNPLRRPKVQTVSRRTIQPAVRHTQVTKLVQEKKAAVTKKEKIVINKKIREVQKPPTYKNKGYGHVFDMQENFIGEFHNEEKRSYNVEIGSMEYIAGIRFDFTKSRVDNGYCLRTTAILTEIGKKELERFLIRIKRSNYQLENRKKRFMMKKRDIKKRYLSQPSHDIMVQDYLAHLNLNGKVEIFTPWAQKLSAIPKTGMGKSAYKRFREYTHNSSVYKWIGETSEPTNKLIGSSVEGLAAVLKEIIRF